MGKSERRSSAHMFWWFAMFLWEVRFRILTIAIHLDLKRNTLIEKVFIEKGPKKKRFEVGGLFLPYRKGSSLLTCFDKENDFSFIMQKGEEKHLRETI